MHYQETLAQWQAADLPDYLDDELASYTPEQQEEAFYQNLSFAD